jgi:hypothetical protein
MLVHRTNRLLSQLILIRAYVDEEARLKATPRASFPPACCSK